MGNCEQRALTETLKALVRPPPPPPDPSQLLITVVKHKLTWLNGQECCFENILLYSHMSLMQGGMLAHTELGTPDNQSKEKAGPLSCVFLGPSALSQGDPSPLAAQAQVIMNTQPFAPLHGFLHTLSRVATSPVSPL